MSAFNSLDSCEFICWRIYIVAYTNRWWELFQGAFNLRPFPFEIGDFSVFFWAPSIEMSHAFIISTHDLKGCEKSICVYDRENWVLSLRYTKRVVHFVRCGRMQDSVSPSQSLEKVEGRELPLVGGCRRPGKHLMSLLQRNGECYI